MAQSPTCVLVPGMLCTEALWKGVRPALLAADARLVDVPLRRDTMDAVARDALAVDAEQLVLIGHSLGGIAALAAARLMPERIAGLALIDTTARPPRPEQCRFWTELVLRTRTETPDQITERTLLQTLIHPSRRSDTRLVDQVLAMARATGTDAFVQQLRAQQSRRDERPGLTRLSCPTLVAAGQQDALCPVPIHEEIATLPARGHLELIDDCGHLAPLERPDILGRLLGSWLTALSTQAPPTARGAGTVTSNRRNRSCHVC